MSTITATAKQEAVVSLNDIIEHWQGHRRLTRRTIEAFPEDKLFTYSIGGMRPFSNLVMESIAMSGPGIIGIATGEWKRWEEPAPPATKADLLKRWDEVTELLNEWWPKVTAERLNESDTAFGQWPGSVYSFIEYFVDNEIHHRGQGYVYLRSLGIEPPAFYDRS